MDAGKAVQALIMSLNAVAKLMKNVIGSSSICSYFKCKADRHVGVMYVCCAVTE